MTKILVVDDEHIICAVLAEQRHAAFSADVECAQTGAQAAQLIAKTPFNLAIIDAILPDMSGLDLALIAVNENIPVFLTTGHPNKINALEEFGFRYLAKPFKYDDLRVMAAEILRETAENIRQLKACAATMAANVDALKAAIEETRKLTAESKL